MPEMEPITIYDAVDLCVIYSPEGRELIFAGQDAEPGCMQDRAGAICVADPGRLYGLIAALQNVLAHIDKKGPVPGRTAAMPGT